MTSVLLKVPNVPIHQWSVSLQHQQVLRVLVLGSSGEVERSRDQGLAVNDHDLE